MSHVCGYCQPCLSIALGQPNAVSQEARGQVASGACLFMRYLVPESARGGLRRQADDPLWPPARLPRASADVMIVKEERCAHHTIA